MAAAAAWTAERRAYRDLLQRKREAFRTKIDAERSAPRRIWQSTDALMGRGHVPLSTSRRTVACRPPQLVEADARLAVGIPRPPFD